MRNGAELQGIAFAMGITESTLRSKITKALRKLNKSPALSDYYWDKKAKKNEGDGLVSIK